MNFSTLRDDTQFAVGAMASFLGALTWFATALALKANPPVAGGVAALIGVLGWLRSWVAFRGIGIAALHSSVWF